MRTFAAAGVAIVAIGCSDAALPVFDPAPIRAAVPAGGLMTGLYTDDAEAPIAAVIDSLTPRSVVDTLETPAEALPLASQSLTDLTLASACSADATITGCTPTPRALFSGTAVIDVHPCDDRNAPCTLGEAGLEEPYGAIIGGDVLSRIALRIDTRPADGPVLQLFTDQPGSNRRRCAAGEAVFVTGLTGGGTLIIQGGEARFPPSRLALNTCLGINPDDLSSVTGADALLLLSTGLGPSILSQSAYRRLRASFAADDPLRPPVLEALPETTIALPSGRASGRAVSISALAITDQIETRTSETRGSCGEYNVRASLGDDALVAREGRFDCGRTPGGPRCPCEPSEVPRGNDTVISCRAAAAVELRPTAGLPFIVVPDDLRLLQALRNELRPGVPQVDGILGMSALVNLRTDLDYPNGRVLMKCGDAPEIGPAECVTFTAINDRARADTTIAANPVARCEP